jgi:hypothetical protein
MELGEEVGLVNSSLVSPELLIGSLAVLGESGKGNSVGLVVGAGM